MLIGISLAVGYVSLAGGLFRSEQRAFAAPVTGLTLPAVSSGVTHTDVSMLRGPAINRTVRAEMPPSGVTVAAPAIPEPTPTAQQVVEDPIVLQAEPAATPVLPPYIVYQVQEGDTVSGIATRFGVDPAYITANNAEIHDSDFLTLGQSVIVPTGNGILHEVRYGETLSDIAARYDVDLEAIASFPANNITTPDTIAETQMVFVPNGAIPVAAPFVEEVPDEDGLTEDGDGESGGESDGGGGSGGGLVAAPSSSGGLIWPVYGPVSSPYGGGHPLGIDIDGFNLGGAAVAAATSGTVIFAGGNACCSYGLYVVVLSSDGIETLYGHLSSISVSEGQTVSQGEAIGVIGATGYSTGVHLHFEVIDNGVRQNPAAYLP